MIAQKWCQSGVSLLEVLISLVLISMILLGFNSVQMVMIKKLRNNRYYAVANLQIANFIERQFAENGTYPVAAWDEENKSLLPGGNSFVLNNGNSFNVTINWIDSLSHKQYLQVSYAK